MWKRLVSDEEGNGLGNSRFLELHSGEHRFMENTVFFAAYKTSPFSSRSELNFDVDFKDNV